MKVKSLYIVLLACSLAIGGIVTYFAYAFSLRLSTQDAQAEFQEMAIIRLVSIKEKLHASQDILLALKAFFESSDEVTQADFANFTSILTKNNAYISTLAWFEKAKNDNQINYHLKYQQANTQNQSLAQDIDPSLFAEHSANAIAVTVLETNQHGSNLVMLALPIVSTANNNDTSTVSQNGFVVMLIDVAQLIVDSVNALPSSPINLSIINHEQVLAEIRASSLSAAKDNTDKTVSTLSELRLSEQVTIADSSWEINAISPIEAFYAHTLLSKLSLALGVIFTLLITYIIHMMMRRHIHVVELVDKKTFDLRHAYKLILKQSKHLESEVAKRTNELMIAKEKAENANKEKSVFLSSMTHELKTPLNAILGFAQLLKNDTVSKLNEDQEDNLSEILNAGEHLSRLITEVLDLARLDAFRDNCNIESVALKDSLEECVRMVQTSSYQQHITIDIADSCAVNILADDVKLKQLILNLVTNAIKYNKPNGQVYIEGHETSDGQFRLSIKDTGLGIPKDKHELIFKAFSRLGMEKTTIEGTGIGLVVTKEIVEMLNGKIGFESKQDKGSTFWFELPLATSTA